MPHPTVSVVLPTYNRAALLERSAGSVLAQDYRSLELILVDDGSTDGTWPIIQRMQAQDPRIRSVRQRNAGAAAARNTGLAIARGKFIAFQDSDDEWLAGHLAGHVSALLSSPDAGVVYSFMTRRRDGTSRLVPDPDSPQLEGDLSRALLRRNLVGTPTALVRRSIIDETGGFDARLPQLEDWDLWIRIAQRARFLLRREATVVSDYQADSLSLDRAGYIDALEAIVLKHHTAFVREPVVLGWHADRIGLHRLLTGRTGEGRDWSFRAWQADHRRWMAGLRGSLPLALARRLQRIRPA